MNVHVCCRPQSQVNYHGTKGERQALYCGPWYEAKESVRRQMALGNQAQPLIGSWSSLQLSQESRVLMQCVAASVKIWWLNGQILPRFVDWEPFLFTLFIHSVNMNNLPVSSFLFFFLSEENHYCMWQTKASGFFYVWHFSTVLTAASFCQGHLSLCLRRAVSHFSVSITGCHTLVHG